MQRTPWYLVASLTCALALSACGNAGADRGWTMAVDTLPSGAIHVVNTPPASDPGPTWTLAEELRIGSVDEAGPASFAVLKGIAVTRDGRIAVLDAQAKEIRVFGPTGAHFATYGGQGAGPGELEGPWGLMQDAGGRLWVPDHANARMSVFDPDSGFVTSYVMRPTPYGFVWSGAMAEDGRIFRPSSTAGPPRRPILRVYGPDMALVDSLPVPQPPEVDRKDPPGSFYWEAPGGLPRGYMAVPFYAQAQSLIDPRGVIWSTAPGDPSYRIKRWTPGGDTTLVLETLRPPVPVTPAERDSVIDAVRERLLERGGANQDWSKIPQVKPAVLALFVTDEGRLWVRTSSPDSLRRYDIYERDGRYAGTVATSLNIWRWVHPVVRGDRFWAIVTDELDVPYVVRARITPVVEIPEGVALAGGRASD